MACLFKAIEPPNCERLTCGESGICDVKDDPMTGFPTITCKCLNGTQFNKPVDCGPCKFIFIYTWIFKQSFSK